MVHWGGGGNAKFSGRKLNGERGTLTWEDRVTLARQIYRKAEPSQAKLKAKLEEYASKGGYTLTIGDPIPKSR